MTDRPWIRRQWRLVAVCALPMLFVLLVALKLLSLPVLTSSAGDAHAAGDGAGVRGAGEKLGVVNVVQRWRAPYVEGTGRSMAGDLDGGRADLERALGLTGSPPEDCTVRTNLVLTVEAQSVAAGEGGDDEARQRLADEALALIDEGPQGCLDGSDDGNGGQAGETQRAAKERLEGGEDEDGDSGEGEPEESEQGEEPAPQDSPTQSPEEQAKEEELQERNRSGQSEAEAKERRDEAERSSDGGFVEKPW
ncbi:hypothetical protein GCM10022199_01990 [Marihabitans asiaticum]|uniref:Uncharacterized protein n=1 Tax=Marihabitans asiaticum TaxID=415218 RepID=A0A560WGC9_9MICO|nr:hypothetical protein [Marihabitans asiaticum]TWD16524.1 hypothetical protein FB557_0047 [Marihabitans asiaticum]